MQHTLKDLKIIRTITGLLPYHSKDFEIKLGVSSDELLKFNQKVEELVSKGQNSNEFEILWSCDEAKLIRASLATILMDMADFEFHAITGYDDEEIWHVLKSIRAKLDNICHPRTSD